MPALISSPAAANVSANEIVHIAYAYARRLGLSREDAQDCAMDFRLHMLKCASPHFENPAWLHRCARNYASNFLRSQVRRQRNERSLTQATASRDGNRQNEALEPKFAGPGPRTLTLRKDLWQQVFKTLRQFTPEQRDLFLRYHLRQQSTGELAKRTGRSSHAIQQSLYAIHHRLARLLLEQGWSIADARQLYTKCP